MFMTANDTATVEETFKSRQDAFHDLSSFNQGNIDRILSANSAKFSVHLPKGIQDTTLETICNFLKNDMENEYTGEEIADKVNLSRVTVKRYMNYLLENGKIIGRMNYETGGRPSMLYKWNMK